ncbi:MAG: alpha/beta hydrolase [Acidobacteria bacterium]|nr:alpha/beta hydrolase [Acidobacteriota bacterium]
MRKLLLGLLLAVPAAAGEPQTILLWPDGAPGAIGAEAVDKPSLTIYLPAKAKAVRAGIVICPGGGYAGLAMDHEGFQIANWYNERGMAAFILKYSLWPRYHHPAMLQDAQRAIRYARTHAAGFGIAADKIGIMGFSAGGHLASTAGTHFDAGEGGAADPLNRASSRPDFLVLCYPVISFTTPYTHKGSRTHLLGENPDPKLVEFLSSEKQVSDQTPPTFLFHTSGDTGVPPENSVLFYLALRAHKVPAELHIYEQGPHGVGLAPGDPILRTWPARLEDWLKVRGMLPRDGPFGTR